LTVNKKPHKQPFDAVCVVWVSRRKFILRVSKKLFDLKIELFDSTSAPGGLGKPVK
jgi:hypothetical protein